MEGLSVLFPIGRFVKRGEGISRDGVNLLFSDLKRDEFNGLLFLALLSESGSFEESALIFEAGDFVAAHYQVLNDCNHACGQEALKKFLDLLNHKCVMDLVELNSEDVKKFLAFNSFLKLPVDEKDFKPAIPLNTTVNKLDRSKGYFSYGQLI